MHYRAIVWILPKCCHQHNPDFQVKNAQKTCFAMDYRICVNVEKKVENNTNVMIHRNTKIFSRYAMDYGICVGINEIL